MKKITLFLIALASYCICSAQTYLPLTGGTLTGQVNGTTANFQTYTLINAANSLNTTLTFPLIYGSVSGGTAFPFLDNSNLIIQSRPSGGDRDIVFVTGSTTPTIRMVVGRTGNIGIGTTSPNYLLSVGGNASSVAGGQLSVQSIPTVTSGIYAGHVSQLIANPAAASSAFYYGILGEAGDNTGATSNFTNTIVGVAGSTVHRGTGSIASLITFLATSPVITNGGIVTNAYGLYINKITNTGVTNSYGVFQSSASDPNYFAGNVGIGTVDNASWKLATSTYKLAVNGSAIATSMVVKLQANWPDYVFRSDYRLPSLAEVKAYVDQNHHLPDMPSEQEVADNGLNLGEINKQLTKKVEELTLYLIEQNKQLAEQKKVNQSLQEQIDKLSDAIKNQSSK